MSREDEVRELSKYPHEYYRLLEKTGDSDDENWVTDIKVTSLDEAEVITSAITEGPFSGEHTIMLDIDVPARLVPSTTPGNSHLYIDVPVKWDDYLDIMYALKQAGILQRGYYRASRKRGCTVLRLPWVKKCKKDTEEDPY
jgi:hypothetical protein